MRIIDNQELYEAVVEALNAERRKPDGCAKTIRTCLARLARLHVRGGAPKRVQQGRGGPVSMGRI